MRPSGRRVLLVLATLVFLGLVTLFVAFAPSPGTWSSLGISERMDLFQSLTGLAAALLALVAIWFTILQIRLGFPQQSLEVTAVMIRSHALHLNPDYQGDPFDDAQPIRIRVEVTCVGAMVNAWAAELEFSSPEQGWNYGGTGSSFPPEHQPGPWSLTNFGSELQLSLSEGGVFFPDQRSLAGVEIPVKGPSCFVEGRWWTDRRVGNIPKQKLVFDRDNATAEYAEQADDDLYWRIRLREGASERTRWQFRRS